MCQAALNNSPWFFTQYSDLFSFYICKEYPDIPENNYAIAKHTNNRFCPFEHEHWHLLIIDCESRENSYPVECPYSTFNLLILENENYEYTGNLLFQLHLAIMYCETSDVVSLDDCYMKLPKLEPEESFLHNIFKIASGVYAPEFHEIVRILLRGKGTISTNSDKISLFLDLK